MSGLKTKVLAWPDILSSVAKEAGPLGFDLIGAAPIGAYNPLVAKSARISEMGDAQNLALVIGNTRALWPVFVRYLQQHPEMRRRPDPLDGYVESCLSAVLGELPVRSEVRWAHKPEPAHVSMQTLAHIAGIGYRTASHLVVHPEYGPWVALRAVAVFPVTGPPDSFEWTRPPCAACATGCGPALAAAVARQDRPALTRDNWTDWLAVRDACPLGKAHRYTDEQVRYHYTKDKRMFEQ